MRKTVRYIIRLAGSIMLLLQVVVLNAQEREPREIFRRFVQMLNMGGKIPLDMQLQIRYSANLQTQPEDTLAIQGEFYLRSHAAYIRMGEQEQLINDTIALLISNNLQRMIYYPKAAAMVNYIRSLPGLQWNDSSVAQLSLQFKITEDEKNKLILHSKILLPGTKLPQTSYALDYDPLTEKPKELRMTKRILVGMDSVQYVALEQVPAYRSNLFTKEGLYFFIKEKLLTVTYKKIEQPMAETLPVIISDRIEWTESGEAKPIGKYLFYQLVKAE